MEQRYNPTSHGIDVERLHEFFRQHGEAVEYGKGEQLERQDEPAQWLAFVEQGCFKYTDNYRGRESNVWFSFENEYVGSYPHLLNGQPAMATIEAMVPARVLRVSGEQLMQFFNQNVENQRLHCCISDHILRQFQTQYIELLSYPPHERYKRLLQRCPGIVDILSLKDIASYLGIQPQTLSKIRKTITFEADK